MDGCVHYELCPGCGAESPIDTDLFVNDIIVCPECGAEVEVISMDPVVFELAPPVEEDWGE